MATYNGARYVRASVNSILAQTFRNFELIVVDDCSTDSTQEILLSFDDPRIRVFRNPVNLGVVASRNLCLARAAGQYIAMLDHDDLSAPTRLAKQVAHLDATPGTVLLGTAASTLHAGRVARMNLGEAESPGLVLWLLHVSNPLVCSSVMFRAEVARRLDVFMREEYRYADDFDFYHRIAVHGAVDRLDERLTLYRLHANNTYRSYQDLMTDNAVKVLRVAYAPLFGADAGEAARLIFQHLSRGLPVPDRASYRRLQEVFDTLNAAFLDRIGPHAAERAALLRQANRYWQRMALATARAGVELRTLLTVKAAGCAPTVSDRMHLLLGRAPMRNVVRDLIRTVVPTDGPKPSAPTAAPTETIYEPHLPDPEAPPTLFVSVDTEAEFDWNKPFDRDLTSVSAIDDVGRGQAVFDRYGLRPIYVVDYAIASQARSVDRLRAILERDGCEIGAHLHPWTNPPFEETLSDSNSYAGNLAAELEDKKLSVLVAAIRSSFGVTPRFYKAGRYGFGRSTQATLTRHGIKIDLSILPGADLRRQGGPDFRGLMPIPYCIKGTDIVSMPMTRLNIGMLPSLERVGQFAQTHPGLRVFRLPSVLARLHLADTVTLTPEGVTAEEQIRLIRTMLRRGYRQFMLHYHSPSLSAGHTPYSRTAAEVERLLDRLDRVCRFFFDELGGLPGYPRDLLTAHTTPATPGAPGPAAEPAYAGTTG